MTVLRIDGVDDVERMDFRVVLPRDLIVDLLDRHPGVVTGDQEAEFLVFYRTRTVFAIERASQGKDVYFLLAVGLRMKICSGAEGSVGGGC